MDFLELEIYTPNNRQKDGEKSLSQSMLRELKSLFSFAIVAEQPTPKSMAVCKFGHQVQFKSGRKWSVDTIMEFPRK